MPDGTGHRVSRALSDRFFDVGIAEQHVVTLQQAWLSGMKPVVAIYSTFCKGHMTKYCMMYVVKIYRLSLL